MKKKNIRQIGFLLFAGILAVLVSSEYFFRIDLTAEKRYSLSSETKQILRRQKDPLHVNIYLSGDMPAGFRKLRKAICEMLDDFKTYSGSRISYRLIDPSDAESAKEREQRYAELHDAGLRPVEIKKKNKDGSLSQQIIFPGAILSRKDRQLAVNLLRNDFGLSPEDKLNSSMEALEYELIKTIHNLSNDSIEKVAFLEGHGELSEAETFDLTMELSNYYQVDRGAINNNPDILTPYRAVIIAKPRTAFTEKEKFVIDRYIMRGGKVMWLIDAVEVNTDSLQSSGFTPVLAAGLNLEDQLFTYGARINPVVVQDELSAQIPVTTGNSQPALAPWLYYPLMYPSPDHPATRRLNIVWLRYTGNIDTVGMNPNVRKTILLRSSDVSRAKSVPFMISLDEVSRMPERRQFDKPRQTTAVLLEGKFLSVFRSRNARSLFPELREEQTEVSADTKMVVVADGDIARNDVRNTPQGFVPSNPLGYDRYSRQTFGNKEFLVNVLNYLTDDVGLMKLRNRDFRLRLLDARKVADRQTALKIINLALPMAIVILGGLAYTFRRKRRYGRISDTKR